MSTIRKRSWVLPSGETKTAWQVDYRDQSGKRRSKQFARKKDAEAWTVTALSEVQRGVHTADSTSLTVTQAANLYLDAVRGMDREPTTIAAYDQHVRLHILPLIGGTKLSQLTAPKVEALFDAWLRDLSRPMAVRVLRTFKAILTHAQKKGNVAQNVALAVTPPRQKRAKPKVRPPSKRLLKDILLAAAESDDLMGRAIVELAIMSGMRASEIRGLAWSALDLKRGRVTVKQRADAKGVLGPPKSEAGHRVVPLPKSLIGTLRKWKLACPAHEADLVFPSKKGKTLSHGVMMRVHVDPIVASANAATKGVHVFRHAAASLWIERGLNAKRVQRLMGHNSIQVTFDTYGHLFDEAEKDEHLANEIEAAIFADAT